MPGCLHEGQGAARSNWKACSFIVLIGTILTCSEDDIRTIEGLGYFMDGNKSPGAN